MGIFASFLDLLWPSRKADPAPHPLPPIDFRALRGGAVYEDLPASAYEPGKVTPLPSDWKPWPPAQFAPEAEARLKKLASSRTREPVQVKPWSKPVKTPLGEFGSVTEAAEAHGIARATLHEYLAKGLDGWERLPKPAVTVRGTRKARRPVWIGSMRCESIEAAAKAAGVSTYTVRRRIALGQMGWRYAD